MSALESKETPVVSDVENIPIKKDPVIEPRIEKSSTPQESVSVKPVAPISLSTLNNSSKKEPSPEKKAELKALLSRVIKKEVPEKKEAEISPTSKSVHTEISEPSAYENTSKHVSHKVDGEQKKIKEVPEDVLRKILGTSV